MDNNIVIITPQELSALVENAVEKVLTKRASAIDSAKPEPESFFIRGIKGLAEYLHVSVPTAQKLKNNRVFPCYQDGRVCVFKSNEVLNGMQNR